VRPGRRVLPPCGAPGALEAGLELGDCLALRHDAPWPLCLVVGQEHLEAYSEVFSALLRARRAARALDALWRRLCARRAGGGGGEAAARLRELRLHVQAAAHAARSVRAFMHEQLLGGLAEGLTHELESAPAPVAAMRAAHATALGRARRLCLLPPAREISGGEVGGGGEREPPWAAPLAAEVNGMLACCWRLQALAFSSGGGDCSGGAAAGAPPCLADDAAWALVAAAGGELRARLGAAREQLAGAVLSEPEWHGLLARLG
jgi:hypothetical protein